MSLFAALRRRGAESAGRQARCLSCRRFRNDRASVAAALPGLSIFASTEASVLADDGLCDLRQILVDGRRGCAAHEPRD